MSFYQLGGDERSGDTNIGIASRIQVRFTMWHLHFTQWHEKDYCLPSFITQVQVTLQGAVLTSNVLKGGGWGAYFEYKHLKQTKAKGCPNFWPRRDPRDRHILFVLGPGCKGRPWHSCTLAPTAICSEKSLYTYFTCTCLPAQFTERLRRAAASAYSIPDKRVKLVVNYNWDLLQLNDMINDG